MRNQHFADGHKLKDELRRLEEAQKLFSQEKLQISGTFTVWDDDADVHEEVRVPLSKEFDIATRAYVTQRIHEIHRILDEWSKEEQ